MSDLMSPFRIHAKGWLFVAIAALAATLLLESPHLRTAALLALCVWASCRFYAFSVIEKHADGRHRFADLGSFARWWLVRRRDRR